MPGAKEKGFVMRALIALFVLSWLVPTDVLTARTTKITVQYDF